MSRITLIDTPLHGLKILQRNPISDSRGFLDRMFCQEALKEILGHKPIRQINCTRTAREGAIRGFHFQYPPFSEIKIVSCLKGQVWDVVVDIRKESPTFLQSFGLLLNAVNYQSLFIPEGFAHGFQTLCTDCELLYFHTQDYNPRAEGGLNVLDPKLAIAWPHDLSERSIRDESHPFLKDTFKGI